MGLHRAKTYVIIEGEGKGKAETWLCPSVFLGVQRNDYGKGDCMAEIGQAIKMARIALGISQYQFASKVGIHPISLSRIESGKAEPSKRVSKSIRDVLAANTVTSPLGSTVVAEAQRLLVNAGSGANVSQ